MRKYWKILGWIGLLAVLALAQPFRIFLFLVFGILLALFLICLDRLLYVWWLKPYEQLSIQIQYWFQRRDFLAVIKLFVSRGREQTKLALSSVGFAILWPFLTLFVSTSTGSVVAKGMVLGLGFSLALSLLGDWFNPAALSLWFGWQIKRSVSPREIKLMAGTYLIVFAVVMGTIILQ